MEKTKNSVPDHAKLAARLLNLKEIEQRVAKIAAGSIIFSPALITKDGVPIITRGTINIIQGRQGSHKSRLAELFCSVLLCPEEKTIESLGFEKVENQRVTVAYVDTERSQTEEFPSAIKSVITKIGFSDSKEVPDFRFTSLKNTERTNRMNDLKIFINDIRKESTNPLFVLLDVITDCLLSFNDLGETMKLLDYIGKLCETCDATFLLVIHENPGSDKARGHLGSESVNKSATVMHIGFEKGSNGEYTELLQLKFIKQRHAKRFDPIPLIFSQDTMSLEIADPALVKSIADQRRSKASVLDIATRLTGYLKPKLEQKELLASLNSDFNCSANTMKGRLEEIERNCTPIDNEHGVACNLKIISTNGKPTVYQLSEIQVVDLVV
ncbi:hypothetical protein [Dyadobacter frigoris]|uniref:AAA family ATPase n=1 Tax=Dyadobacter frigoris TaxID=2576211 RepID=A0A4U6D9G6_9BACT|nr:hypothetical protein [Dyadobacter frigoris]TKT94162.1 hypothetical protein FDK13_02830 [Dyadobacter frigoris]